MKHLILTLSTIFLLAACNHTDDLPSLRGTYENGILVLNEGAFMQGNASISFIGGDFATQNVFEQVNQRNLGDTAQSMALDNENAYIVLNQSNTVEIVNRVEMISEATISEGLQNPRFVVVDAQHIYVSNWGDGTNPNDDFVSIYDLSTYELIETITVTEGPERMILWNNQLIVSHKGGFNFGNQISFINTNSNQVETTLQVGDVPNTMKIINNELYVLCEGIPAWATETQAELYKIKLTDNSISSVLTFPMGEHPSHLTGANQMLYFSQGNQVFGMNASASTLPSAPLFSITSNGGMTIYSLTTNANELYVTDARDYNSSGKLFVYDTNGAFQKEYTVGLLPNGVYFNN